MNGLKGSDVRELHRPKHNKKLNRYKATLKFLNTPEKLEERSRIHESLKNCKPGEELQSIFKILSIDRECLELIFVRIRNCLAKELKTLTDQLKIFAFGSIATNLALRDCDIDVYIDVSSVQLQSTESVWDPLNRKIFNRVYRVLINSKHFLDVLAIRSARVPIVKCKHKDTGFSVDINLSCPSSVDSTRFLQALVEADVRIHFLLLFLKIWAKHMQILLSNHIGDILFATASRELQQSGNFIANKEKLIFDLHDPFEILPMKANETKHVEPSEEDLNGKSEKPQQLDNEKQQHVSFVFTPSRNDIKAIIAHKDCSQSLDDNLQIFKYWSKCYIKAVEIILSQLYRLELNENSTQQEENRSPIKDSGKCEDIKSWFISGSIDLWTSRYHQKTHDRTFMEYHMDQTERLYKARAQNPLYSVDIKALLTLTVAMKYQSIELRLHLPNGSSELILNKKHPLKRFFNMLKCTIANFSLKEALQSSLIS
uniref:Polymerase nucleotidyl transferase domain-containing protein n=1 Tax=Glossina palpalis gambiensis TaxID=67801 RepID=A0A1B0BXE1_9MUSC